MKTLKTLLNTTMLVAFVFTAQITFAQDKVTKSINEVIIQNPTAKENLKVVFDYLNASINNKMDVAESLLSDTCVTTGPSNGESSTKTELIDTWKEIHKVRTDPKNEMIYYTWRIPEGKYKGDWVGIWGTYTFTESGTEVIVPYNYLAMVEGGKIQEARIFYDKLSILTAMGGTVTPPNKK
uniref:nuclear transport factor 2 family protein n=1 Tax=Algoriphagus sp. TaxID=1872435 RepID=UPI0040476654